MNAPRPIVVGVGNAMRRDDGVGLAVTAALRSMAAAPSGFVLDADIVDASGEPSRLVELWTGRRVVVVVDAIRSGGAAGSVRVLDLRRVAPPTTPMASTHGAGLTDAVALAHALGRLPDSLVLVGIEGVHYGHGEGLSHAVAAAVTQAAAWALLAVNLAQPPNWAESSTPVVGCWAQFGGGSVG